MLRAMATAPKDGRLILVLYSDFIGIDAFFWGIGYDTGEEGWCSTVDGCVSTLEDAVGWFECPADVDELMMKGRRLECSKRDDENDPESRQSITADAYNALVADIGNEIVASSKTGMKEEEGHLIGIMEDKYIVLTNAWRKSGLTERQIRKAFKNGKLQGVERGGDIFISLQELQTFAASLPF